jgi:hypothetical protein
MKKLIKRRCVLCGRNLTVNAASKTCGQNRDGHFVETVTLYSENICVKEIETSPAEKKIQYEEWVCIRCVEENEEDDNPYVV